MGTGERTLSSAPWRGKREKNNKVPKGKKKVRIVYWAEETWRNGQKHRPLCHSLVYYVNLGQKLGAEENGSNRRWGKHPQMNDEKKNGRRRKKKGVFEKVQKMGFTTPSGCFGLRPR